MNAAPISTSRGVTRTLLFSPLVKLELERAADMREVGNKSCVRNRKCAFKSFGVYRGEEVDAYLFGRET